MKNGGIIEIYNTDDIEEISLNDSEDTPAPNDSEDTPAPNDSEDIIIDDFATALPEKILREVTAKKLAGILVVGYLILIFIPFLYLFVVIFIQGVDAELLGLVISQVIDLIKTITAVLGGIIGAVVTYYFTLNKNVN